jgi:hypothetical protein
MMWTGFWVQVISSCADHCIPTKALTNLFYAKMGLIAFAMVMMARLKSASSTIRALTMKA